MSMSIATTQIRSTWILISVLFLFLLVGHCQSHRHQHQHQLVGRREQMQQEHRESLSPFQVYQEEGRDKIMGIAKLEPDPFLIVEPSLTISSTPKPKRPTGIPGSGSKSGSRGKSRNRQGKTKSMKAVGVAVTTATSAIATKIETEIQNRNAAKIFNHGKTASNHSDKTDKSKMSSTNSPIIPEINMAFETKTNAPYPKSTHRQSVDTSTLMLSTTPASVTVSVSMESTSPTLTLPASAAPISPISILLTSTPPTTKLPAITQPASASASASESTTPEPRCMKYQPPNVDVAGNQTEKESNLTIWDKNKIIIDTSESNDDCNSPWYLSSKAKLVQTAVAKGDVKTAHYYFAKIDEAHTAPQQLESIIKETYTRELFNHTMEFIQGIFNSTLKLEGYKALLQNLIADDGFSTTSRQELFGLAHQLKTDGESGTFDQILEVFRNVTNAFSQGIKSVVFEPFFRIKNIHDSYVFHYKSPGGSGSEDDPAGSKGGDSGEYWVVTGKCKNCNESKLTAEPDEDYHAFTIRNPHLKGGQNCLGVKNRKALFWVYEPDLDYSSEPDTDSNPSHGAEHKNHGLEYFKLLCKREKWQIKFVGKTLANFIYQPQSLVSLERHSNQSLSEETMSTDDFFRRSSKLAGLGQGGPLNEDNEPIRGFGLTRSGFNKKVNLESTLYLNSNQIWLTA